MATGLGRPKSLRYTRDGSRFILELAPFDNIADHRFRYFTPCDAFDDLNRILNEVQDGPGAELYPIALGPAGTVLATQLADLRHRAIDVGHISNSYHNVFASASWPERMPPVR